MKTLNLLQNMSAEAKVLAMALPMLLLGAMSAMAKQDEGCDFPEKMDMPHIIMQPGDSGRVQPVDYPDGNRLMQPLPAQKPEGAGLDARMTSGRLAGIVVPRPPVPADSANVESVENPAQDGGKEIKLPGQKPEDAGLDYVLQSARVAGIDIPSPVSPDSANVEPAQQPNVNGIPPMPRINRGEPEQDGKYVPRIPGDEDVYESPYIIGNTMTAGIEEVAVENQPAQAAQGVFTLSGILVSDNADLSGLAPGLYIVNGKKMLVR